MKRWTIGSRSGQQADLYLDDPTVSRVHASLTRTDDGKWILEDTNSRNGTVRLVDGRWIRIDKAQVQPDERLRFGRAETTLRQLLGSTQGPVPWRQDMAIAFSRLRDMGEFKRNLVFVFDLLAAPARETLRCAMQRRPVNPFSFMVFGGVMYTLITTFGLTIAAALRLVGPEHSTGQEGYSLPQMFLQAVPQFLVIFTLTLIYNVIPFGIFRRFSAKKRHFDDFMRLMAVVNGLSWMLLSFISLLWNEHFGALRARGLMAPGADNSPAGATFVILTYVLTMVVVGFLSGYAVVSQKHFWKIGYGLTIWCYFLTTVVFVAVMVVIFLPVILLVMFTQ